MSDNYKIQGSTLTAIADAIREKTGESDSMTAAEMPERIDEIEDVFEAIGGEY